MQEPFEEITFFGRDVDLAGVRKAIEEGAKVGKAKLCKHTNFSENYFIAEDDDSEPTDIN